MPTIVPPDPHATLPQDGAERNTAMVASAADSDANGTPVRPTRLRPRTLVALVAFWSVPALLISALSAAERPDLSFPRAFLTFGLPWYFWAVATPTILRLASRYRFDSPHRLRVIVLHVCAGLAAGFLQGITSVSVRMLFGALAEQPPLQAVLTEITFWTPFGLLFYAATLSVGIAIDNQRRLQEREVFVTRVHAQLVEAQLGALRMQLQPHFLFNALNTVAMLVRQGESRTAVRMLARLSDLLRTLLDESGGQEVPLEEELLLLGRYMDIEQVRFGERLSFRTIIDPTARAAFVPTFLLQPLAENAVRHGIARNAAAGGIALAAERAGDGLVLRLRNDGPPLPADWSVQRYARIGLRNTVARLRHLYGEEATLDVANAPDGGVEVRIRIPYHTQPVARDA